jgi:hypothetical protein
MYALVIVLFLQHSLNTEVQERPVEAEFQVIVSYCVDYAIWQDNYPHTRRTPGDGGEPESTLGTYLLKMRTCLLEAEEGAFKKHKPTKAEMEVSEQ